MVRRLLVAAYHIHHTHRPHPPPTPPTTTTTKCVPSSSAFASSTLSMDLIWSMLLPFISAILTSRHGTSRHGTGRSRQITSRHATRLMHFAYRRMWRAKYPLGMSIGRGGRAAVTIDRLNPATPTRLGLFSLAPLLPR